MSDAAARVLVADIGGTHARFALADPAASMPLDRDSIRDYRVADFSGCGEAARRYLDDAGVHPATGVFAVAGPVAGNAVRFTNSPWVIEGEAVAAQLGFASLRLINDFTAMSRALPLLAESDLRAIGAPQRVRFTAAAEQTFAVVGAGTGLGVGALLLRDGHVDVLHTEGGHMSFAPNGREQIDLLERLAGRFGHVSNERLLSGGGLVNLYTALAEIAGVEPEALAPEDVTGRATAKTHPDPLCVQALTIFSEVLGAVAGDLVLGFGAWDGVYLTGGLTPLLLPWFERGGLRQCFEAKGRFAERMRQVPLSAVLDTDAGLLGAAACATQAERG
ncbi:MAG TPA: glucokinase [Rhodanobacteraceae bacterium]|nr:glucokinase [Rhodanobacteraceae bacterium]